MQKNIEILEISNTELTSSNLYSIKSIINHHVIRRNESIWITDFQGKTNVKKNQNYGIMQLILYNDNIIDQFIVDILPILRLDQYFKVINELSIGN